MRKISLRIETSVAPEIGIPVYPVADRGFMTDQLSPDDLRRVMERLQKKRIRFVKVAPKRGAGARGQATSRRSESRHRGRCVF